MGFFSRKPKSEMAEIIPTGKSVAPILFQPSDRGWYTIFESFTGAFQQDVKVDRNAVLAFHAIFSCITLISSDISKLRPRLMQEAKGIRSEIDFGNFGVLARPNAWQNRIQFFENWVMSKLARGNTYILKVRNAKRQVIGLYVLNPDLVQPLVSESGDVFYRLGIDYLSDIDELVIVPASEIIHDRFNCLFHPLVGLSPIYACGLSATQGLSMQKNSAKTFGNMSRPSGILTGPGEINESTAKRLKEQWETNYGGDNIGRIAVLGDDLKFIPLSMTPEDAQLVEQLELSAEIVCSTFHVPKFKVVGDPPSYNNIESLDQQYYSQCLQTLIESIELCLNEGLEIPAKQGVEFDLDGLLRMDTATKIKTLGEGASKGLIAPNEGRKKINLPPVEGGDSPYLQQQNFSLAALAKRDALPNPFAGLPPPDEAAGLDKAPPEEDATAKMLDFLNKKSPEGLVFSEI